MCLKYRLGMVQTIRHDRDAEAFIRRFLLVLGIGDVGVETVTIATW